ncbi:hypothetical protein SAMN05421837_106163 [Amycolatopsis pretoriensis]|uniref:PT repeat-containing protein n=1 Tax=Amycolatopsis pretoriensis TaxID=218821 RepID=A0A1H5R1T9_9PSEU|nr:hypothetical protein [Amycolatopsis pretoriensis]SEF32295.1 hypothetical protein SAMN05421837_106163 [Amycolatopsis pretoriensis]
MRTLMMTVLATLVVLTAGCGGADAGGQGAANAGGSPAATAAGSGDGNALAYAKCMRENGVPNFPDPAEGGGTILDQNGGVDPQSDGFKAANEKCKQHLPNAGKPGKGEDPWAAEDKLAYAKCMRENGVPKFPDPGADGTFPPMVKGGGVDPESAEFQKAEQTCAQYRPANMPKPNRGTGS